MRLQILRRLRRAVLRQIFGACTEDHAQIGELACDQAGFTQAPDTDREIEAFIHQVDIAVVEVEIELDLRIARHEQRHGTRQMQDAEAHRGTHAQPPAWGRTGCRHRKIGLFQLGKWGTQIHESLEQRTGDVQVVKHRVSPFYSTTLMAQLGAQGVDRIYCSGVSTQAVVQATVRDGHDRDFEMVLLEDCCCAASAQEHANSLGSIARFCRTTTGAEVAFE